MYDIKYKVSVANAALERLRPYVNKCGDNWQVMPCEEVRIIFELAEALIRETEIDLIANLNSTGRNTTPTGDNE